MNLRLKISWWAISSSINSSDEYKKGYMFETVSADKCKADTKKLTKQKFG